MQKKTKKIVAAVLGVLFVLSAGYFALLAPTTAWFYQEDQDIFNFEFGDFDMEESIRHAEHNVAVPLRAATRFADAGEILFDEVIHVVKVDVSNIGGSAGSVNVKVTQNDENPGLRWFITSTSSSETELPDAATGGATATKGPYKELVDDMLSTYAVAQVDYADLATEADPDAYYENNYNVKALDALDRNNRQSIRVEPSESRVVYVVFWAEYGEIEDTLFGDLSTIEYEAKVEFTAAPYAPAVQTLTFTSESEARVMLYLNGDTNPYTGNVRVGDDVITVSDGVIVVDGSTMVDIDVGTPFKAVLQDDSFTYDAVSSNGTIAAASAQTMTGTVTTLGNTVTIVSAG